jgi:hypothetical protein
MKTRASESQALQIDHSEDGAHTSHCTQRHDHANANLAPSIKVAIQENGDRNQYECPVGDDVDDAVKIPRGKDENRWQAVR